MIRGVVQFTGKDVVFTEDLAAVRPPRDGFIWVDLQGQTREDLDLLAERFGFHPLALEDCEHLDQLPKVEEYDSHLFLVVHGFSCAGDPSEISLHELHIFFGRRFLVTIHQDTLPTLDRLWARARVEPALMRRGVDFLLYDITDQLVDTHFPILDQLSEAIEDIEDSMMPQYDLPARRRSYPDTRVVIHRILSFKHALVTMRKVLSPQREVFNRLAFRSGGFIDERAAIYFRNVYDHLVRLYEQIDTDRDLLGNVLDAHFSVVSQRTNETVLRLTLLSIVFLPLTFITGFFGMNFTGMPFGNNGLMWGTVGLVAVLPLFLIGWFFKRHWFR